MKKDVFSSFYFAKSRFLLLLTIHYITSTYIFIMWPDQSYIIWLVRTRLHWPTCCTFHIIWISIIIPAPYDIVWNNGHCSYICNLFGVLLATLNVTRCLKTNKIALFIIGDITHVISWSRERKLLFNPRFVQITKNNNRCSKFKNKWDLFTLRKAQQFLRSL